MIHSEELFPFGNHRFFVKQHDEKKIVARSHQVTESMHIMSLFAESKHEKRLAVSKVLFIHPAMAWYSFPSRSTTWACFFSQMMIDQGSLISEALDLGFQVHFFVPSSERNTPADWVQAAKMIFQFYDLGLQSCVGKDMKPLEEEEVRRINLSNDTALLSSCWEFFQFGVSAGGWAGNVLQMAFPTCFRLSQFWSPATGGYTPESWKALGHKPETRMDITFFDIRTAIAFWKKYMGSAEHAHNRVTFELGSNECITHVLEECQLSQTNNVAIEHSGSGHIGALSKQRAWRALGEVNNASAHKASSCNATVPWLPRRIAAFTIMLYCLIDVVTGCGRDIHTVSDKIIDMQAKGSKHFSKYPASHAQVTDILSDGDFESNPGPILETVHLGKI